MKKLLWSKYIQLFVPFLYFFNTRLKVSSIAFHLVFEWFPVVILIFAFYSFQSLHYLIDAFLCYLAFISLYEIGYILNDRVSSSQELNGRGRGSLSLSALYVSLFILTRVFIFLALSHITEFGNQTSWWTFHFSLLSVFMLHNKLRNSDYRVPTFSCLAWFRFISPIIFIVPEDVRFGIAFAAVIGYGNFRQLGYMDSKGLLLFPNRKNRFFRLFFFLVPLFLAFAVYPFQGSDGFTLLITYWAVLSVFGAIISKKS